MVMLNEGSCAVMLLLPYPYFIFLLFRSIHTHYNIISYIYVCERMHAWMDACVGKFFML